MRLEARNGRNARRARSAEAGDSSRVGRRWIPLLLLMLLTLGGPPGEARAQYFGQNKVPGPARDWRVLESEHFHFHFYEAEREAAAEALRIAERTYHRLSRIFDHEVSRPIPVILYASQSEFQETRAVAGLIGESTGGVTEFYKRRVIVPLTGSIAELDHVLSHELVHAFQIDILGRAARGPSLQSLSWMPPLWVIEGLAEYLSVPGIDPHTEMWLRDAVMEGTLPDVGTLAYFADVRVYRFGQSLIGYIAEEFGDEALGPWFRSMALRHSFEQGTSESLGLTSEKLSEGWAEALRRRYFPQLPDHRRPEEAGRRLTRFAKSLAFFHVIPSVSPDGTEMVYVAGDGLHSDLYLASAVDGSRSRRLIRGYREEAYESLRFYTTSVGWAPDGERIALIAKSGGEDRLTIYNVDARRAERELTFGFDEMRSPAWSPSGEEIVFVGQRRGRADLYVVSLADERLRAVTDDRWAAMHPAWSPDGRRIAFVTDRGYQSASMMPERSPWRIALLELESGVVSLLPDQCGKNINPQWFPDGEHLLYISDRTGSANLFVHRLATGADYAVTDLLTGVSSITATGAALSLGANGRRAVVSVYENNGWDLLAIDDPLARVEESEIWRDRMPAVADSAGKESLCVRAAQDLTEAGLADAEEVADPAAATEEGSSAAAHRPGREELRDHSQAPDRMAPPLFDPLADWSLDQGDSMAAKAVAHPPLDLHALFDSTQALPDTVQAEERAYRTRFSLDYAHAGGLYATDFGFLAQTALVFSDMLGDRNIVVAADVSGSLEEGDYWVSYLDQGHRPALSAALYQYWTGYGYGLYPGFVDEYEVRAIRGAGVGLIYPFSRFRRLELWLDGVYERRYRYRCETDAGNPLLCDLRETTSDAWYAVPELSWVYDSAIFGTTGPLSGRRTRVSLGAAVGGRESFGGELDHRSYLNIRRRYAVAFRGVFAGDWGPDGTRMIFGGPYSLRGYTDHPLAGSRIAFMNLEFRFPFIERLFLAWPLPLGIGGVRGALFFDAGAAWDEAHLFRAFRSGKGEGSFRLEDIKAAAGFRASLNLGFLVLRWDLARRTDLAGWIGKAKGELSIGWEY